MTRTAGEQGYTLVEMLAAMAILGLAIGGLAESVHAIGRAQAHAAAALREDQALGQARRSLERLLAAAGPFRADDPDAFDGGGRQLSFACGQARCAARLNGSVLRVRGEAGAGADVPLPEGRRARFLYVDSRGRTSEAWPSPDPARLDRPSRLAAVSIVAAGGPAAPALATAALLVDEPVDCAFDAVGGDCRKGAP
jgi:prepilin-type N-terminal cleavage/methylation domain-containing protein